MAGSGPRSLSDYSETERRIFTAALRIFARKGKDGARMQEIADEAEINKAMLHYYFSGKESLYREVFAFTMARFAASFDIRLEAIPTFEETLRTFIEGYVSFVKENQDAMRLMVNENLTGGSLVGEHLDELRAHRAAPPQVMVEQIERAVQTGEIREVDPHHTILSIISTCIFFFVARPTCEIMHPDGGDWEAFVEDRTEHLYRLIYEGLAPRAERAADETDSHPSSSGQTA